MLKIAFFDQFPRNENGKPAKFDFLAIFALNKDRTNAVKIRSFNNAARYLTVTIFSNDH